MRTKFKYYALCATLLTIAALAADAPWPQRGEPMTKMEQRAVFALRQELGEMCAEAKQRLVAQGKCKLDDSVNVDLGNLVWVVSTAPIASATPGHEGTK